MSLEPHDRSTLNFLCVLSVAVARSSFSGIVTRYVLPVLWMMSCPQMVGPMTLHDPSTLLYSHTSLEVNTGAESGICE